MRTALIVLVIITIVALVVTATLWFTGRRPAREIPPLLPGAPRPIAAEAKTFQVPRGTIPCDLQGATRLVVENKFGNVYVKPGGPQVTVEDATYARGTDQADAEARAQGFRVTTTRSSKDGLKITVEGKEQNTDVGTSLVITAPASLAVKVTAPSGDIRVDDFTSPVTIEGGTGAVLLGHLRGAVRASTTTGDITLLSAQHGLEAYTSSGALKVGGVNGRVVARTMDGAMDLAVVDSQEVRASTMGGPITLTVAAPFYGTLEASSSGGDIRVSLPAASNCRVETTTGSGPITCTLPLRRPHHAGPNVSGLLSRGVGIVRITNNTGAITVSPR